MLKHEHFEELSALAAAGQASVEEYAELQEHLQACESCRHTDDEFNLILEQLPIHEPTTTDKTMQGMESDSLRQRFMLRASAEGIQFTQQALTEPDKRVLHTWNWRSFSYGVALAIAIVAVGSLILKNPIAHHLLSPQTNAEVTPSTAVSQPITPLPKTESSEQEIAQLHQASADAESRLKAIQHDLPRALAEKDNLELDVATWKDRAGQLQDQEQQNEQQLVEASARIRKLEQDNSGLTASMVEQQLRIHNLENESQIQAAAVEREKQLTAASHDVRELMGARSLHIIDVADLDGNGIPKKTFGRVFFSEQKLLIFYAFDLSRTRKGSAANIAFQAWGQSPGKNVRNLGFFHIDDQTQKRWVLRVDNPELLKSVEAVFVTVEPSPGRERPSGPKLLYAYLGAEPNHP